MLTAGCGAGGGATMSDSWAVEETAAASYDAGMSNDTGFDAASARSYSAQKNASVETSGSGVDYNAEDMPDGAADENAGSAAAEVSDAAEEQNAERTGRKLIRTVNISAQTTGFDAAAEAIRKSVDEFGGYIESSGIYDYGYYGGSGRTSNYTIRIPEDRLDAFLDKTLDGVNVISRNESVEDITLRYTDLESRVNALETEQERLFELMGQADSVDAVIAIETRLSEVRYELESIKSSLKVYDNQIDYSTIYLTLDEVKVTDAAGGASFTERIVSGLQGNILKAGELAEDIVIFIITVLPIAIVFAIPLIIIILVIRMLLKKRKAKKHVARTASEDITGSNPVQNSEISKSAETAGKNAQEADACGKISADDSTENDKE